MARLIAGVVKRQASYVLLDPYANAFNAAENGRCHNRDKTEMSGWIWERKYELDSLCAPLLLAHALWTRTGDAVHLDSTFADAARLIVATIALEQHHEHSNYRFERLEGPPSDTLSNAGFGAPTGYTGMSWSGFRPSDDACQYNYLVPANMMAAVALERLGGLPLGDKALSDQARAWRRKSAAESRPMGAWFTPNSEKSMPTRLMASATPTSWMTPMPPACSLRRGSAFAGVMMKPIGGLALSS